MDSLNVINITVAKMMAPVQSSLKKNIDNYRPKIIEILNTVGGYINNTDVYRILLIVPIAIPILVSFISIGGQWMRPLKGYIYT